MQVFCFLGPKQPEVSSNLRCQQSNPVAAHPSLSSAALLRRGRGDGGEADFLSLSLVLLSVSWGFAVIPYCPMSLVYQDTKLSTDAGSLGPSLSSLSCPSLSSLSCPVFFRKVLSVKSPSPYLGVKLLTPAQFCILCHLFLFFEIIKLSTPLTQTQEE